MCSFCFNKIESDNKICPGCRTPYNKDNYITKEPTKEELNLFKLYQNKKLHKKGKKDTSHNDSLSKKDHSHSTSSLSASTPSSSTSSLPHKYTSYSTTSLSRSTQERQYSNHHMPSLSSSASTVYTSSENNTNDDDNTSEQPKTPPFGEKDLRSLSDTRVVQRNLVYVTNIPLGYISHVNIHINIFNILLILILIFILFYFINI